MAKDLPAIAGGSYDEFVDWDARFDRERSFFEALFRPAGVSYVIDVGAGSARHAIMFATWGIDVIAVDPDDSMLEQARENVERFAPDVRAGGGSVTVTRGGFGELQPLGLDAADALTCTGNALPHVGGRAALAATLLDFAAVLKPGGLLVLHLLNHQRLLAARIRAIAPKVRETAQGTKVFLRLIDYPEGEEYLDFDFVTLLRDADGDWSLTSRRSQHTALPRDVLTDALGTAGFTDVETFGDHSRRPLDPLADESMIVTARRRA
ncbi:MAG: class I SAM-dependent methyltransferase [Actinomycetota bacterium]|nr:class I SAM-dependent methyltransferase [Actinomycetota bacterium]